MKKLIAVLSMALQITVATAQFSVGSDANIMYDDNIDNNYLQLTDRVMSVSLGLEYFWDSESRETGISYTGNMNYYSTIYERSYLSNELLFMYTQAVGNEDATTLDFNAGISTRTGRGDFTVFDHQIYHGLALIEHDFSEYTSGELGYLLQVVRFNNLTDFNYLENKISGQYHMTFSTRTSVTIGSDFGIKIYSSQASATTDTSGGGGQGSGGGSPMGTRIYTSSQTSTPTVTQLGFMARVAQSIFDGTGLALTGQYQWNIRKESRYLYGTIPDDVIFDDHYGYEGLLLGAMFTQLLPLDSRIRISAGRQKRIYSTLPAYDLNGVLVSDKREDSRYLYTVQLKKDFEDLGLSFDVTFDHIKNFSNDAFYDYTNNAVTLGISWLIY